MVVHYIQRNSSKREKIFQQDNNNQHPIGQQ